MTEHELTRRDALIALGAGGVTVGAGALTWQQLADDDTADSGGFSDRQRQTLLALARTIYPQPVSNVESFVEQYVVGKALERSDYATGMADALDELNEYAQTWEESHFTALDDGARDQLLREFGVDTAEPDPDGRRQERVRYYLVNELQFALYSAPTGGELVGLENPQGHPGGTESYQRPPPEERE
jgi:hypothetical protein